MQTNVNNISVIVIYKSYLCLYMKY